MDEPDDLESTQDRQVTAGSESVAISHAVWTVPNLISMARIALIGVFGWLLVTGHDLWAVGALAAAGISDFLDGFLARRWNQVTALGRVLDPAADRLLTIVVIVGLALRGVVPWWLVAVLFTRDALVAVTLIWARGRHLAAPRITFVGKAATAALYFFLPLAFLAFERWDTVYDVAIVGAWMTAGIYWYSGIAYVQDLVRRADKTDRGASAAAAQ